LYEPQRQLQLIQNRRHNLTVRFYVIPISELDFAVFMTKLYEERKKVDVAAALRYEPINVHQCQQNGLDEIQKRFQSDGDRILFLTPNNLGLVRGESLKQNR
jgi:hypothetical protein